MAERTKSAVVLSPCVCWEVRVSAAGREQSRAVHHLELSLHRSLLLLALSPAPLS